MTEPWQINAELRMTPEVAEAIADGVELPEILVTALKEAVAHHRKTGKSGRVLVLLPDEALERSDEDGGGITPEGQALGHRYVMGNVNAYCPKCSEEQGVAVLDCDYDLDK